MHISRCRNCKQCFLNKTYNICSWWWWLEMNIKVLKSAKVCNQKFNVIYLDNIRQQARLKYIFNEPLTHI